MGEYTKHGYKLDQTGQQTQDILDAVNGKVDKVAGKGLSTNDYTDEDKAKVDGLVNPVQPDWNENDNTKLDYVKNRTHHIEWSRAIYVDVTNTGNPDGTLANMTFEVKATPTVYFDYIGDVEGKKTYRRPRVKVGNIISYLQVEIYESGSSIVASLYFGGSSVGTNTLSGTLDTGFSLSGLGDEVLVEEYYKLNNKFLDLDEVPTSGSAKPVTSGGVSSAISNFITKSVNDLTYYYLKTETYSQTEINNLIGAIQQFHYEIAASTSAVTDPQPNVLYLIGPTGSGADKYEEYVYANSTWTKIGDTSIDLSDYVTTTALNTALADYTTTANLTTLLAGKQDTIDSTHKLDYSLLSNTPTIPAAPGTLNTNNTGAQSVSSSEALSGTVKLHKVAKTGSYADLNNKPTIPTISTNIEADKTSDTKTASPKAVYDAIQANTEPDLTPVVDSDATFVSRAVTPKSGVGRIQKIKGKTLVWNQGFTPRTTETEVNGITVTPLEDGRLYIHGTSSAAVTALPLSSAVVPGIAGHKYYVHGPRTNNDNCYVQWANIGAYASSAPSIHTCTTPGTNYAYLRCNSGVQINWTGGIFIIDLTQEFGSGNEPATVAEFEALYPLPYYNNNAGTLINNGAASFQTKDGNDVVDTKTLNLTTITGKLNGEGSSVTIFPEGLKSAGTVFDELVGNKAIKRMGKVDLGSLTWAKDTTTVPGKTLFVAPLTGPKTYFAGICGKYVFVGNYTGLVDKSCSYIYGTKIAVQDSSYDNSDASSFASAVSGVYLYYELATPLEYVLDTPLDLTFDTGTTEERLPADTASSVLAPFVADITYGLTTSEIIDRDVFHAIKGVTPLADINAAYEKGQYILLHVKITYLGDVVVPLDNGDSSNLFFAFVQWLGNTVRKYRISLNRSTGVYSDSSKELETVGNKVTSISSSSTDTQYPSAKTTYDNIHPAIGTTQPSGGFLPNVLYNLGTLTGTVTFELATPADANIVNHYYWTFDADTTAPTITWPTGLTWKGGSAPTISASKHYEISVLNGIAAYMEV